LPSIGSFLLFFLGVCVGVREVGGVGEAVGGGGAFGRVEVEEGGEEGHAAVGGEEVAVAAGVEEQITEVFLDAGSVAVVCVCVCVFILE
jgi:hypothetical protein